MCHTYQVPSTPLSSILDRLKGDVMKGVEIARFSSPYNILLYYKDGVDDNTHTFVFWLFGYCEVLSV